MGLLDLIDRYRGAFEYDWRTRFHKPLTIVGTRGMTWGEAIRLTTILLADPSSMLTAEREQWKYPVTRGDAVLMDLYDLQHAAKSKRRPAPYPRPWAAGGAKRRGKTDMNRAEVIAVLEQFGHQLN